MMKRNTKKCSLRYYSHMFMMGRVRSIWVQQVLTGCNQSSNWFHSISFINTLKTRSTFPWKKSSNHTQLRGWHISSEPSMPQLFIRSEKEKFHTLPVLSASSEDSKTSTSASSGVVSTQLSCSLQRKCPARMKNTHERREITSQVCNTANTDTPEAIT